MKWTRPHVHCTWFHFFPHISSRHTKNSLPLLYKRWSEINGDMPKCSVSQTAHRSIESHTFGNKRYTLRLPAFGTIFSHCNDSTFQDDSEPKREFSYCNIIAYNCNKTETHRAMDWLCPSSFICLSSQNLPRINWHAGKGFPSLRKQMRSWFPLGPELTLLISVLNELISSK